MLVTLGCGAGLKNGSEIIGRKQPPHATSYADPQFATVLSACHWVMRSKHITKEVYWVSQKWRAKPNYFQGNSSFSHQQTNQSLWCTALLVQEGLQQMRQVPGLRKEVKKKKDMRTTAILGFLNPSAPVSRKRLPGALCLNANPRTTSITVQNI